MYKIETKIYYVEESARCKRPNIMFEINGRGYSFDLPTGLTQKQIDEIDHRFSRIIYLVLDNVQNDVASGLQRKLRHLLGL